MTATAKYDEEYGYCDYEPVQRGFCDVYEVFEPHIYSAINGNVYDCPGMTRKDLAELHATMDAECEHGMSLISCSGPMHW